MTGSIHRNCQLVAVKRSHSAKRFFSERRAAALISAVSHSHIVPLLFSFSHRHNNYLVSPWATSNLAEFWEDNKLYLRNESCMEYPQALWVAEQCEGLADALRYIHRFVSTSPDDDSKFSSYHHGNIKPENILVYCSPHRKPVLQIADFGTSTYSTDLEYNRPFTDSNHAVSDYIAPEVYFGEAVSSSSDVWSMCCIFLEFIEWIMPSQSAPGQPKRVLTEFEEAGEYVEGREAFGDWRRSRVESGADDVASYFFDPSTGELSLWIDTVSDDPFLKLDGPGVVIILDSTRELLLMTHTSGCMTLKITLFAQNGYVPWWATWMNIFFNKMPRTGYQVEIYTVGCDTYVGPVRILCMVLDLRLSLSINRPTIME